MSVVSLLERICDACEIKPECREWSVSTGQIGYWGGQYLSENGDRNGNDAESIQSGGDGDYLPDVWSGDQPEMPEEQW